MAQSKMDGRRDGDIDYMNNHSRDSVRRHIQAATFERQISENCPIKPISVAEYNEKVKRLKTVVLRNITPGTDYRDGSLQPPTGRQRRKRHIDSNKSSFLNRVITHFGAEKAKLESDPTNIAASVEQFIELLMQAVGERDPRFKGTLIACGSYYEGVKVKRPNEFDYTCIWQLESDCLSIEKLQFDHVTPETFKPRKHQDIYGRSYFKLSFNDKVHRDWMCPSCKALNDCIHNKSLQSRKIQENFREMVQSVASHLIPGNNPQITSNGPAVTIFTQLASEDAEKFLNKRGKKKLKKHADEIDFFLIKIDITLAILVRKNNQEASWPLQGYGDIELDREMIGQEDIGECHLVTAGDFWRVSFSYRETSLVQQLTQDVQKKICFQALKYLRDELALTDDHETALLGTYPLKVTFLKETKQFEEAADWKTVSISDRTRNILKSLEQDGAEGKLTSYFIKNDPVLLESDRSYIESRRIRQYLDKLSHHYRINGFTHMSIMIAFVLCHIISVIVSVVYITEETAYKCPLKPSFDIPEPVLDLSKYTFALMPLTFLGVLLAAVGFLWIIIQRFCLRSSNVLYQMFLGPFYLYIVFTLLGLVEAFIAVRMAVGISEGNIFDQKCKMPTDLAVNLAYTICGISGCILGYLVVHTILFLLKTGRRVKYYSWELIFFDKIYHEIYMACKNHFAHADDDYYPYVQNPMNSSLTVGTALQNSRSNETHSNEDIYEDVQQQQPPFPLSADTLISLGTEPQITNLSELNTAITNHSKAGTNSSVPLNAPQPNPRIIPREAPPVPPRNKGPVPDLSPEYSYDNSVYTIK